MNIVFRVDSSPNIGSGHVYRCLTWARFLRDQGCSVHFVVRDFEESVTKHILDFGFKVHLLIRKDDGYVGYPDVPHAQWLATSSDTDAKETIEAIKDLGRVDWMVVDHYALDYRWHTLLRPFVKSLVVIDDLADRKHDCDLVMDQISFNKDRYSDLVSEDTIQCLGPAYALLRNDFSEMRKNAVFRESVENVFVFFGSQDADGITAKVLDVIHVEDYPNMTFHVVVGELSGSFSQVQDLATRHENIRVYEYVPHMAEFLANMDLCIGAGGTTVLERCCLGIPSLVIGLSENQWIAAKEFNEYKVYQYLGTVDQALLIIKGRFSDLAEHSQIRLDMRRRAMETVDGLGVQRMTEQIGLSPICLRSDLSSEDAQMIHKWRNDSLVRGNSNDDREIGLDEHMTWFKNVQNDETRALRVASSLNGEEHYGVIRVDRMNENGEVSIYMNPEYAGKGLGTRILRMADKVAEDLNVKDMTAKILSRNKASQRVFSKAGYTQVSDETWRKVL